MGYTSTQAKTFIAQIAPIIQKKAFEKGYKFPSAIIAQAICESAAGTSSLGWKYHNYFGMKCGSSWKGASVNLSTKEEYTAGTLTNIKANFRVYDSIEEGVEGYFQFISSNRYANLKQAKDPKDYLMRIKEDGYATSSAYITTNYSLITKYNLALYDIVPVVKVEKEEKPVETVTTCPYSEPAVMVKKGSSGESARWVQWMLNKKGANLKVDGQFGSKSVAALRDFQKKNGLAVDGICGPATRSKLKE